MALVTGNTGTPTNNDDFIYGLSVGDNTYDGLGGDDLIFGDSGTITTTFGTGFADAVDITAATTFWDQDANPDVAGDTTVPHRAILYDTGGTEAWYSVTVLAGQTITLDVDYGTHDIGGSTDTVLGIYSSDGTTLVAGGSGLGGGDDSLLTDGAFGSTSTLDSFLTFTFAVGGTYFIRANEIDGTAFDANETFMLNVSLTGQTAPNTVTFGNDTLSGSAGNDTLYGVNGSDTLDGGANTDTLRGGAGDDTLVLAASADDAAGEIYDGGTGTDTLHLGTSAGGDFSLDLSDDAVLSIEKLVFDAAIGVLDSVLVDADQFGAGLAANLQVQGLAGAAVSEQLSVDMAGSMTLDLSGLQFSGFDNAGDGVFITGAFSGETITGSEIRDVVTGAAGNDIINGGLGDDRLDGGSDVDAIHGGAGNDQIVVQIGEDTAGETYDGGDDTDTLFVTGSGGLSYSVQLDDDTLGSIEGIVLASPGAGHSAGLLLAAVQFGDGISSAATITGSDDAAGAERVTVAMKASTSLDLSGVTFANFTNPADLVTVLGDGDDESITGSGVADLLDGGGGADILDGGGGKDTLQGGLGNDSYQLGAGNDSVADTGGTADEITSTVSRSLLNYSGIENLAMVGSQAATGTGSDGDNVLNGLQGAGANLLIGGGGDDTYVLGAGDKEKENPSGGTDTVQANVSHKLGANVENLELLSTAGNGKGTGNAGANALAGNEFDNKLSGKGGADAIMGGAGHDRLFGGKGADTLGGGTGADEVHAGKDDARDVFVFSSGHDSGRKLKAADRLFDFDTHGKHETISDKIDLSALHVKFQDIDIAANGPNLKVAVDTHGSSKPDTVFLVMNVDHLHRADFIL